MLSAAYSRNTVALNYEKLGKSPNTKTKIEPFLDKYNWK